MEAISFRAVTRYRNYSSWREHLTPEQWEFVDSRPQHSVKLQGPAGSGKTLALELKALRELYRAREDGRGVRILFATHSWAVAEQVDKALHDLNESGDISPIEVSPLLEIVRSILPPERRPGPEFRLLGDDSLEGKRQQLERIDEALDRLVKGTWLAYRHQGSSEFRSRVEAPRGSPERNALVWDLMVEFYSVLSAHGILPGVNAERRYLALPRSGWMMALTTESDKKFMVRVYTEYINALKMDRVLTSDQLVNDFLNYLETFTWDLRRERDGYDLLFVDELQLFSEQERLLLHYLTRSAAEYPKIFMAVDPRQAPWEVYGDFAVAQGVRGRPDEADPELGTVTPLELSRVYRFSPEILGLVKHIQRRYPALDLGQDWQMEVDSVESGAAHGEKPFLYMHRTQSGEIAVMAERTKRLVAGSPPGERLAVILVEELQLPTYEEGLAAGASVRLSIIRSRDDIDRLQYARRSVVVGPAEYLAGLQFDSVIIGGLPNTRTGLANLGYQRRRLLRLLYLAVSRATQHVEIHVNDEAGGVPQVLETAFNAGLMQRGEADQ